MDLANKLRDAFKRKRYGSEGEYDPDFDLFDAAADEIDRLNKVITELNFALENANNRLDAALSRS